jgi:hypothetical protein
MRRVADRRRLTRARVDVKHSYEVMHHYRHFSTRARDGERPGRAERDVCDAFVAFVARERERCA